MLMMLRSLLTAVVFALFMAFTGSARAEFLAGYLAQCTAVATGSCTEASGTGYARQPITFSNAVNGVTVNSTPYSFGSFAGMLAGRAVYDAATSGNLLLVIPVASGFSSPPIDQSDIGRLSFTISAMTALRSGLLYTAIVPAATVIGVTPDGSSVSSGVRDVIRSGLLTSALPAFDASYGGLQTVTTGFAITSLTNQATFGLTGAGTLATGAVALPSTPSDGQSFRLACGVTVTALTVTAPGRTLSGAPTTCGPTAGHEWFYMGGSVNTWFDLF